MHKRIAAIGLAAGLAAGGFAGVALTTPALSGAQTSTTEATAQDPAVDQAERPDRPDRPDRSAMLVETLAPLVADGTITQAQADAVIAKLQEAGPKEGPGGRHGKGAKLDAAATAIGISVDELRTALESGQTIAQVAESKGVNVQTVIDALVADAKAHFAEDVASGKHTQEEVDQKLADLEERITEMVNNPRPARPERPAQDTEAPTQAPS